MNSLGYLRVMFTVEDIDDTVARLRRLGAEVVDEIVDYEDTYRLCYIRGPERILIGLAQVALARGDTDAAADFLERALAVAPNDIEAWFRKGEVLRQRGDGAGALAAYDRALAINPGTLRVRLATY